ncbi:MAG: type IV pilin protein [Pseudomonadota bacterium]
MMSKRQCAGVSLIELIFVVAIIGIVASLAYPNFQDKARRAKRTDAKVALLGVAAAQEKYFLRNNRYAVNTGELGIDRTENGYYDLNISSESASVFTARAAANDTGGQQFDEACQVFQIDEAGRKTANNASNTDNSVECWQK